MTRPFTWILTAAAALIMSLSLPTHALAQAPGQQARPGKKAKAGKRAKAAGQPAALAAKRAKVRQRIRALRAWRLTEALDLDDVTAGKLFPIINRFDGRFSKAAEQGARLRKQLRKAMRGKTSAAQTNKLIDQMVAHQKTNWRLQEQRFKAVRAVLTPAQAATILVVLPEIDRKIQRQIRRAMRKKARGAPGGENIKNPFDGAPRRERRRQRPGRIVNPF